jgi:hypothetical protein
MIDGEKIVRQLVVIDVNPLSCASLRQRRKSDDKVS